MPADLLASVRAWAVDDIQIGNRYFRIPPLAADVWLEILLPDEMNSWDIVPGLLEPDAEDHLTDLLTTGGFSEEDYKQLVWDIITVVAGRDWWSAMYLIGSAKHVNAIDVVRAKLVMYHIDATSISLAAWLDAIYGIFIENMPATDRQKFDAALLRPPPGVKATIDRTRNNAAFMELMSTSQ